MIALYLQTHKLDGFLSIVFFVPVLSPFHASLQLKYFIYCSRKSIENHLSSPHSTFQPLKSSLALFCLHIVVNLHLLNNMEKMLKSLKVQFLCILQLLRKSLLSWIVFRILQWPAVTFCLEVRVNREIKKDKTCVLQSWNNSPCRFDLCLTMHHQCR